MPPELYGPAGLLVALVAAVGFLARDHLASDARDRERSAQDNATLRRERDEAIQIAREAQDVARRAQARARRQP